MINFERLWAGFDKLMEHKNQQIWDHLWKEAIEQDFSTAQMDAARAFGLVKNVTYQTNPRQVNEYYKEHGLELVKTLTETDKQAFKTFLDKNFDLPYDQFMEKAKDTFVASDTRAKAIWDTERHNAYTAGYDNYVKDYVENSGAQVYKTWHHSGNPHPRPTHIAMHGITVKMDETFPNGEDTPTGVHCGCWLEYRDHRPEESEGLPPGIEPSDIEQPTPLDETIETLPREEYFSKINEAETGTEISDLMNDRNPNLYAFLDDCNPEYAKDIATKYDVLAGDYPEVAAKIEQISIEPATWMEDSKGWMAGATGDGKAIALNENYFGVASEVNLKERLDVNVLTEFHPPGCNTPASIISHEFGHMAMNDIVTGVIASAALDQWLNEYRDDARSISKYAAKDDGEMFANAFASIYHTPIHNQVPAVKALSALLSKYKEGLLDKTTTLGFSATESPQMGVPITTPKITISPNISTAKTADDVAAILKSEYGVNVSFKGMSLDNAKSVANGIQKLVKIPEFTGAISDVPTISTQSTFGPNSKIYAVTDRGTHEITLNDDFFGDNTIQTKLNNDVSNGFHPIGCADPGSVVVHEIGHDIENNITATNPNEYDEIDKAITAAGPDAVSKVSTYATTNNREAFAEIVSSMVYTPESQQAPLVKTIKNIIDKYEGK